MDIAADKSIGFNRIRNWLTMKIHFFDVVYKAQEIKGDMKRKFCTG